MATSEESIFLFSVQTTDSTSQNLEIHGAPFTLLKLKHKIARACLIPVEFQRLFDQSGAILEQSNFTQKDQRIQVTLQVTFQAICGRLERGNAKELDDTLPIIGKAPHLCKGEDSLITALVIRLGDEDHLVRKSVLRIFSRVADKGDENTIVAVVSQLADQYACIRQAAVETLCQVAKKGDRRTIMALAFLLKDSHANVRQAAVKALFFLTDKGEKRTIMAAVSSQDASVRKEAIQALCQYQTVEQEVLLDKPSPPEFLVIGRLRHTTPFVHRFVVPLKLKHEKRRLPLADLLGLLYPIPGGASNSSASREFWHAEVMAGRVEYLRHSKSLEDFPQWEVGGITLSPSRVMDETTRGGKLRITTHVHEPAVAAGVPSVLYEDDVMVVVDKPAGVPCTATGPSLSLCRANVLAMLEEVIHGTLVPVHRLDQPVSGVLIFARSTRTCWHINAALAGGSKRYLARVLGRFPHGGGDDDNGIALSSEQNLVVVDIPLRIVSICAGQESAEGGRAVLKDCATTEPGPDSKPARTSFCFLAYDEATDTSLIEARLHSGRRHQIRAHLAVLGHPIANDDLYCPGGVGAKACPPKKRRDIVHNTTTLNLATSMKHPTGEQPIFRDDIAAGSPLREMFLKARVPWCHSCEWALAQLDVTTRGIKTNEEVSMWRVATAGARIWLHALEYQFKLDDVQYCFRSPLPEFVWREQVPDADGICSKIIAS